jgi:hypothetical protein
MESKDGRKSPGGGRACLALFCAITTFFPFSSAAEYPRRIAIAPFSSLAKEDIQQTVSVLPRLLSSRLMAQAGAEVTVLPPAEKPAAETAKEAGFPLLLQGTVAKLGKGYSIDVTVLDLATGKTAGAFFAAANTEDDIIPQVGTLSSELAEKLFGIKPAARSVPAPVSLPQAAPPAGGPPAALPAVRAPSSVDKPAAVQDQAAETAPGPAWTPAVLKRVSESDKIAEAIYGVVAGDADGQGNVDVIAYGHSTIHIYRVKGTEILPYTKIARGAGHHFLNVEASDIDGDGRKEILVTDLYNERLMSFVLKRKGDGYEEVADGIHAFLVVLPDWMGKPVVAGQGNGLEEPFQGKFYRMNWDGKTLKEGEPLPPDTNLSPLSSGIIGLSALRIGSEWRFLYTDRQEKLRVLDPKGKSLYKSGELYGSGMDSFEWGSYDRTEGKRPQFPLNKAARVVHGGDGKPFVLVPSIKKGFVNRLLGSQELSRLVLLQWEAGEFVEKAVTAKSDKIYTSADLLSSKGFRKGGMIVAAMIVQEESTLSKAESRLMLLSLE